MYLHSFAYTLKIQRWGGLLAEMDYNIRDNIFISF